MNDWDIDEDARGCFLQAVNFHAHKHICEVLRKKQRASRLRAIENVLWGVKEKSGAWPMLGPSLQP